MSTEPIAFPSLGKDDPARARRLWVELATRITTQRLHYRSGDEETAVASIHSLFDTTRKLLAEAGESVAFDFAAVFMLNRVIRPYTARWHRWLVDKRFRSEIARRQFRKELTALRPRLEAFQRLFRAVADSRPPDESLLEACFGKLEEGKIMIEGEPASRLARMGGDVRSGINEQISFFRPPAATPFAERKDINTAEGKTLWQRRRALGYSHPKDTEEGSVTNAAGLSLSGGGIRSATFCLGVVQVLAEKGVLAQFDYLSTVSGGGYCGAFLSSYLGTQAGVKRVAGQEANPGATDDTSIRRRIEKAFAPHPGGDESAAVRHLRNNSRYLLNGGWWGRLRVAGLLLSGLVTNFLVVLPLPLLAVLAVLAAWHAGYWGITGGVIDREWHRLRPAAWPDNAAAGAWLILAGALAACWLVLAWLQNTTHASAPESKGAKVRSFWINLTLLFTLGVAAAASLLFLPAALHGYAQARGALRSAGDIPWTEAVIGLAATAGTFLSGVLAARLGGTGWGKKIAAALFTVSGPLLLVFLFFFVGSRVIPPVPPAKEVWRWEVLAWVAGGLLGWGWSCLNINAYGLHRYYRDRLCECYLITRDPAADQKAAPRWLRWLIHGRSGTGGQVGTLQSLRLSDLGSDLAAPYHLINATVNLPASKEPNLRGRASDFFIFSRHFCGGPVCGYVPTAEIEKRDPHFDLGTAMAVSGAAVSSNMGALTLHPFRFLLALANIRLGYWLRNPRLGHWGWLSRVFGAPGPAYLLAEMTGWMHEHARYLNVSDGGHIENLALYELLRRRCKYIVVVDAGMEPGMEAADLLLVQRYAAIDLGIKLEFDLADLMPDEKRISRAHAVLGKIFYEPPDPSGGGSGALGWLVYIKLAIAGSEPGYVGDYRRQHPDFPHQSTAGQIFEEAQFEAYRALGEVAARSLFDEELTEPFRSAQQRPPSGGEWRPKMADWFQAMATSLLPDNDDAFREHGPLQNQTTAG